MAIFEYGKYKIDIDEEATEKYFEEAEINDCKGLRNFQKYVSEMMSDEEKAFFEALHINLSKVDYCYGSLNKAKKWYCNIQTYIIGEFLSYPQTAYVTLAEVKEQGIEFLENNQSNIISVGNFHIHISTPEEYDNSCDDYENSIYIEFNLENIPWLLKEKCDEKEISKLRASFEYYLLNAIRFIPNILRRRKESKMEHKKLIEELELLKSNIGVEYEILNDKETKKYRKEWVDHILPESASEETRAVAYENCLPNKKFNTFLWHIFSFDLVKTIENPTEEFKKLRKRDCTLIFEANKFFTVKLKNAENLAEQDIIDLCNRVSGWCDFVITADDYLWAYSRTHEDGWCGPYFYRKD